MVDLAIHSDGAPVTLAGVSERQLISLSYLEQLFGRLRRHGLVESVRGPGGGYCIAKPLDRISVAQIILAVDEPLDATKCGGKANCKGDGPCLTHNLWTDLTDQIYSYLESITLDQLIYGKMNQGEARMAFAPA